MTKLIDGRALADKILVDLRRRVARLARQGIRPRLAVILVGNDPASVLYVRRKGKAAKAIGLRFTLVKLPARVPRRALLEKIKKLQIKPDLAGLIVQLPLPKTLNHPEVLNAIRPEIDVDCLTDVNLGKLMRGAPDFIPPTPAAILAILKSLRCQLLGSNITIVGTGLLVGRPLAMLCMQAGASVTTVNSRSGGLKEKCRAADIIISAVGIPNLIRGNMVKPRAIVIDAGSGLVGNKVAGDVHLPSVQRIAAAVTPTPGGVGPLTVAKLLENTVRCAERLW
ncbi:MAG: bifunctional 5,10-methylenetetrahydrofolate dehydrogenase/5,10-methenyltetrahydrofolate cyclohydrolase [Candidatus Magasanikbacteria bacterium]|nr:bifunctional 5,10-methylenetetrahydrofolate dehydrogenase/5,10-methenyltetrahydrofolate cyclohydrolase [Candidatus Magasanikbacteria bacterium]